MKILYFSGGLGNQIFEYAFCLYLKERFPEESLYGIYDSNKLGEHYGLEIDKWFDVQLPPDSKKAVIVTALLYFLKRSVGWQKWLDLSRRKCENLDAMCFNAFKLTNMYFCEKDNSWIRFIVTRNDLSDKNKTVLDKIESSNSFFVHVRRGDYLSPTFRDRFAGCCPLSYYKSAISDVLKTEKEPRFFCFSDDLKWMKENLDLPNAEYIDWNTGTDSPIDMYLMSHCKGAIMANSTFSYWGAYIGRKKKVYYPEKWINAEEGNPNIFFEEWKKF